MITANDHYQGIQRMSRERFSAVLRDRAAPAVLAERDPGEYWDAIVAQRADPAFVLAVFNHESGMGKYGFAAQTKSWGNTRPPSFGAQQIGVATQASGGQLSKYATWRDGCVSTAARLTTPAWVYHGRTIGQVFTGTPTSAEVWAPAGDSNDPAGYLRSVLDFMNRYADQPGNEPAAAPLPPPGGSTVEIIDVRHLLPTNPGGGSGERYAEKDGIIVHYSGPAVDRSADTLTVLRSYANYHIGPYLNEAGIAYHYDIGNDERIRLLRDPDAVLWHCARWPENRTYWAIHVMLGGDQHATAGQRTALDALVTHLREQRPIPRESVKGHQEVSATSCPGTLMEDFVLPYRANQGGGTVADGWRFPETGHYVGGGFYQYWRDHGGLVIFGLPLSEELKEGGRTVQYFERACFEYYPENDPPYQVLLRRLGADAAKAAGLTGAGIV